MKKPSWSGAAFLALSYGTNAVYQGYISKFYQQRGARDSALAWLLVSFPLTSVFAQPLWGRLADRSGSRTAVLKICVLASILPLMLLARQSSFSGMLICSCAFAACYPAIQPLADSVILESLQKRPFGPARLAGCLAFAMGGLAAGRLLRDDYAAVPGAVAFCLCGVLASAFFLPRSRRDPRRRRKYALFSALRVPYMTRLLALFMLLQTTLGYFYSYYAVFFTGLPGGGSGRLGVSLFLASLSEIPFLLASDRLFRRFGAGRLMLGAALALSARFLMLSVCRDLAAVMLSQLLHGMGFVVMTFCMAKYIASAVPEELRAGGQTLTAAASGAARVFGALAGGWLRGAFGLQTGFGVMAGLDFLAFLLFCGTFLQGAPLNGRR